ncbi:ral GEF with PH domain and SH3 binding motif isoform X2 [Lycorma delicatula]
MAKMRYSEMPRDISCDSLSTLRIIEEKCEKKSPVSDNDEPTTPTFNGDHSTCLIRTPKRLPRTPTSDSIKKTPPCYDNLGAVGVHNKSQSLPANASLAGMGQVVLEALRISPEDFAAQLTLLDIAVFREIAPDELLSCAWNKKNKSTVAPNVVAFTRRFNHVSFWTVQEILTGTSPKHRAEIMAHFIRIGKKLYELNNFHSLFAIISGLQCASIYRLSKSWSYLSKKDKQTFDKLAEVFSDANNWKNLRDHMESLKLPCIPYLGVFLTDLVYIDMAHPHTHSGIEPEQRRHKMNNILRIVANLQQSQYPSLVTLPHIQRYLRSVRYIEELQKFVEDDQYKLSLKLEPPSPAPSSSSSKESVSDTMFAVASLNLSPAKVPLRLQPVTKFVPGHRKCHSLGTKFRSTSLPRNLYKQGDTPTPILNPSDIVGVFTKPQPRHLLDDSVMEEDSRFHASLPVAHDRAPLSRRQSIGVGIGATEPQFDIEEAVSLQGCLRRKTVLKDGRKPAVSSWQRYWVQLWTTALVFYLPKCFKGNDRCDFKKEPCKMAPMTGCIVSLSENPLQPDVFLIRDPHRSNMYKFRAINQAAALEWYEALCSVLGTTDEKTASMNLISFE